MTTNPTAFATAIIPLAASEMPLEFRSDISAVSHLTWRDGVLGRLHKSESADVPDHAETHGARVAAYSAAASPRTMWGLFQRRTHVDLFDAPIRLINHAAPVELHPTELAAWNAIEIHAIEFISLTKADIYVEHVELPDLVILHVALATDNSESALRLLLRLNGGLTRAVLAELFESRDSQKRALDTYHGQAVGIGIALRPLMSDGSFASDESTVFWDVELNRQNIALLNGRLTNVALVAAVQFHSLIWLQVMWPHPRDEEDDWWEVFRGGLRAVRQSLLWPVVDFNSDAQACYKQLRDCLFIPELSSTLIANMEEKHQDMLISFQARMSASQLESAQRANRLAIGAAVFAVLSLAIGIVQVLVSR